ncbi:MAG TPA: adenylate/guanylate cyclase domain-containing protein [Solirubrobacterales bacterium]|nr:adenylate/guanylate cyclase domain-containing protein [Solirubrobacterales bacterium]
MPEGRDETTPDQKPIKRLAVAARRLNRQPQLLRSVQRTRERLLGGDEFVDRLSTSRDRPSDLAVQHLAELRGETPGVFGELGLTALQAWQRLAESQDRGRGEADVAILFTDLVGFSSWALEAGDEPALRLLREVSEAIEPPVAERQGEVVKRLGDGLMAAFWDAQSAAEAAFAAHQRVAAVEVEGFRPQLRTGIHLGRPRKVGGDYLGVDVNVAARLCDAAKPGEILVSDRALLKLDPHKVKAKNRRFRAKGAPKELAVYVLTPASD